MIHNSEAVCYAAGISHATQELYSFDLLPEETIHFILRLVEAFSRVGYGGKLGRSRAQREPVHTSEWLDRNGFVFISIIYCLFVVNEEQKLLAVDFLRVRRSEIHGQSL